MEERFNLIPDSFRGFNAAASLKRDLVSVMDVAYWSFRGFNAAASLKLPSGEAGRLLDGAASAVLMPRPH